MTIKDAMKKFVVGKGGTTSLKSTTDLHDEINQEMGELINPLMALTVDTDVAADTDLLGKTIGDLQANVHVYRESVEGTLFFVDDYTGFSGDPKEQVGYFIVLHATVPGESGYTITVKSPTGKTVTLDADGILVLHVLDKYGVVSFTASKDGEESYTRTFDLSRLFRVSIPATGNDVPSGGLTPADIVDPHEGTN